MILFSLTYNTHNPSYCDIQSITKRMSIKSTVPSLGVWCFTCHQLNLIYRKGLWTSVSVWGESVLLVPAHTFLVRKKQKKTARLELCAESQTVSNQRLN